MDWFDCLLIVLVFSLFDYLYVVLRVYDWCAACGPYLVVCCGWLIWCFVFVWCLVFGLVLCVG